MCWRDFLEAVRDHLPHVTGVQVRWAITSGKVSRPPHDGSLRFVFTQQHVDEALAYFGSRGTATRASAGH